MHETTYLFLFFATSAYALILERFRRDATHHYAPRWTWVTVVVGVAIVGAFVALHLLAGIPTGNAATVAWRVWWIWFWHFVAGGAPIIAWQVIVDRRDIEQALRASMSRRQG